MRACHACDGDGFIFDRTAPIGAEPPTCDTCHGSGEVKDEDWICPECDGEGWIEYLVDVDRTAREPCRRCCDPYDYAEWMSLNWRRYP